MQGWQQQTVSSGGSLPRFGEIAADAVSRLSDLGPAMSRPVRHEHARVLEHVGDRRRVIPEERVLQEGLEFFR